MKLLDFVAAIQSVNTGSFHETARVLRELVTRTSGVATGTSSSNAATINGMHGILTTASLNTAHQTDVTAQVITNNKVAAGDLVIAQIVGGTNTAGSAMIKSVTVAANTITVVIRNAHHTTGAFNGTIQIGFTVIKAA